MTQVVKLFDEKKLITSLKNDTVFIINQCRDVSAIKKLLDCYDVLDLTLTIAEQFPSEFPKPPTCDYHALLHLKVRTEELVVYHHPNLPKPQFPKFTYDIKNLLMIFRVPKEQYGL